MRPVSSVSRLRGLVAYLLVLVAAICAGGSSPRPQDLAGEQNALVGQMVSEVSIDRLSQTIGEFAKVPTRFSPTSGCRLAGTSIYNYFSRLPLAVDYDAFRYSSFRAGPMPSGRNVVATVRGIESPDRMVVVGAHYDSTSNEPWRLAPGADDNASGTAAVLEIARIVSSRRFNLTIELVAFDAEELGSFGSEHLAALAKADGRTIVAVLNLDMIGYDDHGRRGLAVVPDRKSEWLADRLIDAARRYGVPTKIVKRVNVRWARSDQTNFQSSGFAAVHVSEDMPDENPYYHTKRDTPDTLDMKFVADVTRAALATVAGLAEPMGRTDR